MLIEARPRGLQVNYRPGNVVAIDFVWPSGELTGRTFAAYLGTTALSVVVNGDVMTVEASAAVTSGRTVNEQWRLADTTGGQSQTLLTGTWRPSNAPAATPQTTSEVVVIESLEVVVTVNSGQAGITALSTRSSLESIGATVDQTAARVLEARWLAFIRNCGSASPTHPSFQYLGGDVTDVFQVPGADDVLWIGADWFDGTTVSSATDLYAGEALPVRNGAVQETTPGTFAMQFHKVGSTGVWLDAVADGGQAAGLIWWPLCIVNDGGSMRVGCLLVDPSVLPYGEIVTSHIVTLNVFGGYASHIDIGIDGFEVDGMWRDTTHTYITSEHHLGNPIGDKHTHLARVTNGSLLTVASWQHWDGSAWVSDPDTSSHILDTDGNEIIGDITIAKVASGRYVLVHHDAIDATHLDVYNAALPEGPYIRHARVPLPGSIGNTVNGGTQITQIPRILPSNVLVTAAEKPPAEHSMVMLSRNVLDATSSWTERNIRRYCPQFVVVPNH